LPDEVKSLDGAVSVQSEPTCASEPPWAKDVKKYYLKFDVGVVVELL
jgi:hypothetical protein